MWLAVTSYDVGCSLKITASHLVLSVLKTQLNFFAMTRNEDTSRYESQSLGVGEQDSHDVEQDASTPDQADSRQRDSKRIRISVLVGSAILQLPIWGKMGLSSWLWLYSYI